MKQILEGSRAIAETIKLCRPAVVSAYPITPQTHIVEDLAKMKAEGEADFEYVIAESEFSAASVVLGASATGSRVYTASSSQGLLLMTEVIFNIAGLELPVVLTCANRAVGAPINIWNDQQDVMTVRDSGWIQLFASDMQKAVDLHILAYRIAESAKLPVMVNVDGFYITHTISEVEIPDQKLVDKFLKTQGSTLGDSPRLNLGRAFLDVKNPKTFGYLATPDVYHDIRINLDKKIKKAKNGDIKKSITEFKNIFGRSIGVLETYKTKDAETIFVTTGSLFGTTMEAVNNLRAKGKKVGVLHITLFRPFPEKEIFNALMKAKRIIVLNRALSLGAEGILTTEIKSALYGAKNIKIQDEIVGLGGRDMRVEEVMGLVVGSK